MTEGPEPIEELLEIMREHDLDALSVRAGEYAYELVRTDPGPGVRPHPADAEAQTTDADAAGEGLKKVTAPIIGVFYRSSSPGAEPFVEVGDRVVAGQVLCILEAMKLMNEITSDYDGIVARILPENGQLVSLGEEMFWIAP
jgi:acetyl-CoA carboxylase biotin carboxyl carrier protein